MIKLICIIICLLSTNFSYQIIENGNSYINNPVLNINDLKNGESYSFEITPELRQKYFALARIKDWYHLPNFTETDNLPTEPINYWFMLLNDGAVGWDKNGQLILESPDRKSVV